LQTACASAGVDAAIDGGRQHYLRVSMPETLEAQEAAGLRYDSSLGYADAAGFRCGTCYEFPVYSLHAGRTLAIRERPLIAMDATFSGYMRLSPEVAASELAKLKQTCRRFDGDFVLLWHNTHLGDPEMLAVYRAGLDA
jgi:hypothetical protein